jgi:membrane-associated protein
METLRDLLDVVLHLDRHLNEWAGWMGAWLYLLLFVIVFCETGLVVTPFLPGDSLLFAVGAICSVENATVSLPIAMAVLIVAAILGDAVNYSLGRYLGPAVFTSANSRFLNPKHIERTHAFYEKYGGKTIFLARFVPIVRTFAPFVAGIGQMDYRHFAVWNVTGAIVWVVSLSLAGYFFGQIPIVKQNFESVILGIIVISLLPMVIEFVRARRGAAASGPS